MDEKLNRFSMQIGRVLNFMTVEKRIRQIVSSWFYTEPLLFAVSCNHLIAENKNMGIPFRSGRLRIEFSPDLLAEKTDGQLENLLKVELCRILLAHPYSRQPLNCQKKILLLASDVTLYQNGAVADDVQLSGVEYLKSLAGRFHTIENPLGQKWAGSDEEKFFMRNLNVDRKSGRLELLDRLSFEQWYKRLFFLVSQIAAAGENAGKNAGQLNFSAAAEESAELWEENEEAQAEIQQNIQKADADEGWGGIGGNLERLLSESCDFSFDYRRTLSQFRQNIASARRRLTRMRPSRRYGLKAMGSLYERKANLLIAVDTSGSISDESFEHFTHAIKNFFFLGIVEKIDLIFFDVNLKNTTPVSFGSKAVPEKMQGRGGTNFQPAINFFENHRHEYSGMIIFTDGEGEIPKVKNSCEILWILDSRRAWEKSRQWIRAIGSKCTFLPF